MILDKQTKCTQLNMQAVKESTFSEQKAQGKKLMQRSSARLNNANNQNRASNGNVVIIPGCKGFISI